MKKLFDEFIYIKTILEKHLKGNSYREVNLESWYHELLESPSLTEEEKTLLDCMQTLRETFNEIESRSNKRYEALGHLRPRSYDWDSRPIYTWEQSFKSVLFPKHVGLDFINGWSISTVWLGVNAALFEGDDPLIFATMIFKEDLKIQNDDELKDYQEHYTYLQQAEIGHKKACDLVILRTSEGFT